MAYSWLSGYLLCASSVQNCKWVPSCRCWENRTVTPVNTSSYRYLQSADTVSHRMLKYFKAFRTSGGGIVARVLVSNKKNCGAVEVMAVWSGSGARNSPNIREMWLSGIFPLICVRTPDSATSFAILRGFLKFSMDAESSTTLRRAVKVGVLNIFQFALMAFTCPTETGSGHIFFNDC